MTESPFPPSHDRKDRTFFITFLYFQPGGREKLREYMTRIGPLWQEYGLGNAGTIEVGMTRAIEGENLVPKPDQIRFNFAEDLERFQAFNADPRAQDLAPLRASAVQQVTALLAKEEDLGTRRTVSDAPVSERLYVVQLLDFHDDGKTHFESFASRGASLFDEYGLRFDYWMQPFKKVDAAGDGSKVPLPDKVVLFHADDPERLNAYNEDPRYLELAPIRAEGVRHNRLFGGKLLQSED